MTNTLKVTVKNVYGNDLVYPACEKSKKFIELLGCKTFTKEDVRLIKELGYNFEVVIIRNV